MKTWEEIKDERDHACEVARNAANCLGSLYNILGNVEEFGAAKSQARMAQCLAVLDSELSTVQRDRREVVAAITERIARLPNDKLRHGGEKP